MNDFTKEELIEIKRCVKYMCEEGITPYSCLTLEINKKLQSIINNYCDHESAYIDYDHQALRCKKCLNIVE